MMDTRLEMGLIEEFVKRNPRKKFVPGETYIPTSGKRVDAEEALAAIDAILDGHWTDGKVCEAFEEEMARRFKRQSAVFVNSGSSANLLAITAAIRDAPIIMPRREVITPAVTFPTTINPIWQNGAVPRIIDVEDDTLVPALYQIEQAYDPSLTIGVVIPDTLGNLPQLSEIVEFCRQYKIFFVHDCCDSYGGKYQGMETTVYGDYATTSHYPAHGFTTIEGGTVLCSTEKSIRVRSLRDWGRSCTCKTGEDNSCGARFRKCQGIPWDHKYMYSECGYNLKADDVRAAIGLVQLSYFDVSVKKRKENYEFLVDGVYGLEERGLVETLWCHYGADFVPFGFAIREKTGRKDELVRFLESNKIGTRQVFAGNIARQLYATHMGYVADPLPNSDIIMKEWFWIGCHQSITIDMIDYMIDKLEEFYVGKG